MVWTSDNRARPIELTEAGYVFGEREIYLGAGGNGRTHP